jgi:DNA-binding beta-propeller fold protein YncE
MKMIFVAVISFLLLFVGIGICQVQSQNSGYKVVEKIKIGGEGGWDYLTVDSTMNRLYVSHGTKVEVIDLKNKNLFGQIPNTNGVHGIALAPEFGKGFTSNGRDSSVTVFDLKSLKTLTSIKLAVRNPDAIVYDQFAKRIFTFNGGSQSTTAIDAKSDTVIGTLVVGGKPEFAVPADNGTMYVNIEDKSEIVAFNTQTLKINTRWSISPGEEPSGLAIDSEHHRLFSVCGNKLLIVSDLDSSKLKASLPIGDGVDGVAFDESTQFIFSSNGEGTLTVIHEDSPDKYTVLENVVTQRGARTLSLDQRTHNIYLCTAQFGPAPAPTADRPHPRPKIVSDTFTILVLAR